MAIVNTSVQKAALPAVMATRLDEVRRREASLRLAIGLADALALFLAVLFGALVLDWALTLFSTSARQALTYVALGAGALGLLLLAVLPRFKRRTLPELAATVDRSVPDLEERWETVTRLNASSDPQTMTGSPVLIDRVVAESIERNYLIDAQSVIPARKLRKHQALLAAAIGAILLLFVIDPAQTWVLLRRFCAPTSSVSLTQVTAASGDLAVARGEPIRLEAALAGRPREKADLFLRNSQGQVTSLSLTASAAAGTHFEHAIDAADEPFAYRFRAGDGQTAWHDVVVYERPRLTNVELRLTPPGYTHLPAVTKAELPTSLRAVEGSRLEVAFSVDQPLDHFDLQFGSNSYSRISPKGSDPLRYLFQTKLEKTIRFTPVFVNQHGLTNLRPPSCQVIVYADRPPEVAIISPDREISLRPNDKVTIEFAARDDFGVVRAELVAFVGNQPDLQNAQVLPPQTANASKQGKTGTASKSLAAQSQKATAAQRAATMKAAAQRAANMKAAAQRAASMKDDTAQPGSPATKQDGKPAGAQPESKPSPGSADKTTPGADEKSEAASRQAPPQTQAPSAQTIVIPIPLAGQTGEKTVRGKIQLDLKQFQLKQGQQLQYMVRVYDTRSAQSNGQSYGDAAKSQSTADKSMADKQGPNGRRKDASQPPAGGAPPKEASKQSRSESVAKAGKSDASASRPSPKTRSPKMAKAAQREQSAQKNKNTTQKETSKIAANQPSSKSSPAESERASSNKETSSQDKSTGQVTGASPENTMPQRLLDVDSQSTASSTMKIHIDKFAGSFEGQQRRKLEILIDPVLKELDAALAKAIDELRPASDALADGKKPGEDFKKSLRAAETQIGRGQSLVADLVQKTDGTPYAFIGLQLVDITELHISPARLDVKSAKAETPDRKDRLLQGIVHLTRAREMLADLTRKYESAKRDLQLAEDMQRIKMMYQVFIEDAMAFLAANRPNLNPKDRKMAQLELDEEFLKQYRELAQEWEKTLAELAKVLAKDPRLLARYMNLSRRSVNNLRDQLTLLNVRQQELLIPVAQLAGEGPAAAAPTGPNAGDAAPAANREPANGEAAKDPSSPQQLSPKQQMAAGAQAVSASLVRDLGEIAAGSISVQEDLGAWLPEKMKDDQRLLSLREQAAKVSSLATLAAIAAGKADTQKASPAAKQVGELATQLKALEASLAKLAESDDAQLAVPVNRRLAKVRKLQQSTAAWLQKSAHVTAQRYPRALEMDQHRLSEDTLELTGKLESAGAQLAGLPEEVVAIADEVKDALRYDVLVEQMSAELKLRDGDLADAKSHQKKAIEGFTRAEERFNKLIDRVIEEQDKVPPQVPDLDNMQLPTLEELLARLESETDLAELLGIPDRPDNLQALRGWLLRNQQGSGMGMMAGARRQAQLIDQARRDALRAVRKNEKSEGRPRPTPVAAHWNTLGSRLEDAVRQGRGNTPPRQYRRAIERYFELISGAKNSAENAAAAAPAKESGKENPPAPGGPTSKQP